MFRITREILAVFLILAGAFAGLYFVPSQYTQQIVETDFFVQFVGRVFDLAHERLGIAPEVARFEEGTLSVRNSPEDPWRPAHMGERLIEGIEVKTEKAQTATLRLRSNRMITLDSNASATLRYSQSETLNLRQNDIVVSAGIVHVQKSKTSLAPARMSGPLGPDKWVELSSDRDVGISPFAFEDASLADAIAELGNKTAGYIGPEVSGLDTIKNGLVEAAREKLKPRQQEITAQAEEFERIRLAQKNRDLHPERKIASVTPPLKSKTTEDYISPNGSRWTQTTPISRLGRIAAGSDFVKQPSRSVGRGLASVGGSDDGRRPSSVDTSVSSRSSADNLIEGLLRKGDCTGARGVVDGLEGDQSKSRDLTVWSSLKRAQIQRRCVE